MGSHEEIQKRFFHVIDDWDSFVINRHHHCYHLQQVCVEFRALPRII